MNYVSIFVIVLISSFACSTHATDSEDPFTSLTLRVLSSNAYDFNKIASFLLNNPIYLDKLNTPKATSFIASVSDLQKFVTQKADGTKSVDWASLLADKNARNTIQSLINKRLAGVKTARQASELNLILPSFDFSHIAEFLLANSTYLAKLNTDKTTEFIASIPYLQTFIITNSDGTESVDWISLLNDQQAKNIMQNLTMEHLIMSSSSRIKSRQLIMPDFSDINSVLSVFTPLFDRLKVQFTNQSQKFIAATFQSLVGEVTGMIFSGKPIDYNVIAQKVLASLSASIAEGVSNEFQYDAQSLLNTEFSFLNDLLGQLDAQQIVPPLFVDFIKSNSVDFKNQLQSYIPIFSDIIMNAVDSNMIGSLFSQIDFNSLVG